MAPAGPSRDEVNDAIGDGQPAEPTEVTLDEGALYVVIRKAVEDALLGVIGTLLLVGLALVLIWMGATMALTTDARAGVVPVLVGGVLVLVGFYIAAATLEVIPPIREWF